jgi:hypothetical protein
MNRFTTALKSGLGFCFGAGLVLVALPSMAQTTTNPIQDLLRQDNPNDIGSILNGNTGTGAASIMNLMNRISNMDGRSPDELSADQKENLNNAAEAFRRQQQQRLEVNPAAPAPTVKP